MEEKMISIDAWTPQSIKDKDAAQQQRKLTNFGASSATANLSQKVVKADLLLSGFLIEHNLPLITADHNAKLFRNMFPDSKMVN